MRGEARRRRRKGGGEEKDNEDVEQVVNGREEGWGWRDTLNLKCGAMLSHRSQVN